MKLTEEQKEIALRVAEERGIYLNAHDDMIVKFAARFLAALPKPEPVGEVRVIAVERDYYRQIETFAEFAAGIELEDGQKIYTESPIAPPASEQKPVAWVTTNEDGDYAMLFFDKQEARSYSGDDEPIGLAPVSASALLPEQENYKAQRDAARWRYARQYLSIEDIELWQTEMKGHKPSEEENAKADSAIDAALASVKGGA